MWSVVLVICLSMYVPNAGNVSNVLASTCQILEKSLVRNAKTDTMLGKLIAVLVDQIMCCTKTTPKNHETQYIVALTKRNYLKIKEKKHCLTFLTPKRVAGDKD